MQRSVVVVFLTCLAIAAVPATAHADIRLTPFAGVTFGGNADSQQLATGAGMTLMGQVVGFEAEFGYSPDFFGEREGIALISDSNVTTFTGSLVIGSGRGRVRPYAAFGLGLMRVRAETEDLFAEVTANDWAANAGAGLLVVISDRVGLRGDLRYFTRLVDPDEDNDLDVSFGRFHYWRASGGLSFRF
jgi:hypothetical protein